LSLSVAAKAAGYDSPRTLTRHCLSHTGFAPHELRESAEEQVVHAPEVRETTDADSSHPAAFR
jgi:AraC-like DNA-binding protein